MKVPSLNQFAAAARALPEEARVPYAFEKRIMARLAGEKLAEISGSLAAMMWRAALGCLAISLLTTAFVTLAGPSSTELFATDLERTVLAPVDVEDSW